MTAIKLKYKYLNPARHETLTVVQFLLFGIMTPFFTNGAARQLNAE